MKLLVISDNHGNNRNFVKILGQEAPFDILVHAGDLCNTESYYQQVAGDEIPFEYVYGNCDYESMNMRRTFVADRYRVLLTHGHLLGVDYGPDTLIEEAKKEHCRMVIYGHTHVPGIAWVPDDTRCRWRRLRDEKSAARLDVFRSKDVTGGGIMGGVLMMNPGSTSRPRQNNGRPSYITVTIDRGGAVEAKVHYL